MEYRTAIVDETGWVMYWCDELQGWDQIETILEGHPEWSVKAIERCISGSAKELGNSYYCK